VLFLFFSVLEPLSCASSSCCILPHGVTVYFQCGKYRNYIQPLNLSLIVYAVTRGNYYTGGSDYRTCMLYYPSLYFTNHVRCGLQFIGCKNSQPTTFMYFCLQNPRVVGTEWTRFTAPCVISKRLSKGLATVVTRRESCQSDRDWLTSNFLAFRKMRTGQSTDFLLTMLNESRRK
jgi:hypothetical protein